jgi:hypothetical protein
MEPIRAAAACFGSAEDAAMPMTDPEDLDAIRRALGLDRAAVPYRNHYPARWDDPLAQRMLERGLLRRGEAAPGGLVLFQVTEAGARLVGASLPALSPRG